MKLSHLVAFVTLPLMFLFSTLAFGQPCPDVDVHIVNEATAQQEWWMVLLAGLMQLVSPIIIAVLGTLVSIAIRKWGRKMDVDTQDRLIDVTQRLIAGGVAFAEEQGRKALKVGEAQSNGASKLQHAMDYVQERLQESGFSEIATDRLQKLIEAKLHAERSNPMGIVPSDPAGTETYGTVPTEDLAVATSE